MSASNSHSQTHRSPDRSSLSRSQSPEFWSTVHIPVCHYHTLFRSVLCTPPLWGIVCFVARFYLERWFFLECIPPVYDRFLLDSQFMYFCLFPAGTLAYQISWMTLLAFSLPVLLPFWTPVYDLLPAPGPSYLPPPVVLYNKHLLRPALETSSLSPIVFITNGVHTKHRIIHNTNS